MLEERGACKEGIEYFVRNEYEKVDFKENGIRLFSGEVLLWCYSNWIIENFEMTGKSVYESQKKTITFFYKKGRIVDLKTIFA